MSNTDRNHKRALVALGMSLCAIVFVTWLSQETHNPKTGYRTPQTEYSQNGDITRLVSAIERFDPWEDTFAQWLMAGLSVVATGISAWAVILVRDSLSLNRQAVKAAEDAVTEARRIGEAQVRAYLSIRPAVIPPMEGAPLDHRRSFEVEIENAGQTPARNVNAVVYADWLPRKLPSPCPNLVRMRDGSTQADLTIAAGSSINVSAETKVTDLDFLTKDTNAGPTVPHLYGIVWYNDVFGRPHRTRFAFLAQAVVYTDRFPKIGDHAGLGIALSATSEHNDED